MPHRIIATGGMDRDGQPTVSIIFNGSYVTGDATAVRVLVTIPLKEADELAYSIRRAGTFAVLSVGAAAEEHAKQALPQTCQQSPEELQAQLEALDKGCGCC